MKQQDRGQTVSRLFNRVRISALGILAMAAMAQATITAKVTISTYSAFASQNAGATPGMLIFMRSATNDYNYAAGIQWLTINGNGTYTTTLGTAGYYWTGFNNSNSYQAMSCTVAGLPNISSPGTYLADGTTVNMTITCTEPDVTAPVFSSAVVSSTGTTITITFNESVESSYANASAFSVTAGGTNIAISSVSYSGSTAILTLASAITSGKTVLVSYTGSGIQDTSRNYTSTFTNKAVTNNSTIVLAAPTVKTGSASSITSSSATLAGTVTANNATTADSIQYGTSTSYGTTVVASPATTTGASATSITASLSGLAPNTTYHYRVKAVNSVGPANGSDATFTTLAIVPTAATGSASAITSSSATLTGTVNANNASTVVTFDYGTTSNYGSSLTAALSPVTGTAATTVIGLLPNLLPNTTYHYRVKAVNTAGTTNGTDATFTTSKLTQTIAASQAISGSYGDTVSLSATATSGLSVTWTSTDTSAVKIVSESKAVLRKVGKATVLASQLGNTSYDSAASVLCTLTVGRKALHIAGMAAADKIYDGTITATVSGGHLDSVLAGDSVTLVPGTARFAGKNVGTALSVSLAGYAIAGRDSASYELHQANQTALTASILAKKLLVTALNTDKIVRAEDPVLTYKDTGLVAGDNLTGALVRSAGDTAGSYAIGQGTLTAGSNYNLVFVPGTFTIKPNSVTGIEGGAPVRLRTLGTLGLSTLKKLPAMASGAAHPELGLGKLDGETQRLSLLLPAPATILIDIFDLLGVPVISWSTKIDEATWRSLDAAEGGRTATVSWNLRAENGTAVPAGVYLWKIKATTVDGQQLETVKRMGVK